MIINRSNQTTEQMETVWMHTDKTVVWSSLFSSCFACSEFYLSLNFLSFFKSKYSHNDKSMSFFLYNVYKYI